MGFSVGQYGSRTFMIGGRPFQTPLHEPSYALKRLAEELKPALANFSKGSADDPYNQFGTALKETVVYYEGLRDKFERTLGPGAENVVNQGTKQNFQKKLSELNEALDRLYVKISSNPADVFFFLSVNSVPPALAEAFLHLDRASEACRELLHFISLADRRQEHFHLDEFQHSQKSASGPTLQAPYPSSSSLDTEFLRRKQFREKLVRAVCGELIKCAIDPNTPPELKANTSKALLLNAVHLVHENVLNEERRSPSEAREIALSRVSQGPDDLKLLTNAFDRILQASENGDINDANAVKNLVRQTLDEFGVPITSGLDYKILESIDPTLRQMLLKLAPEVAVAQTQAPTQAQGNFAVQTSATHEFLLEQLVHHQWNVAAKSRVLEVQTTQKPIQIQTQNNFHAEDGTIRTFFEAVQPVEVETIVQLDFVASCDAAHLALLTALQNGELTQASSSASHKSGDPISPASTPPSDGKVLHLQDEIFSDIRGRVKAFVDYTMVAHSLFESGFKVEQISSNPLRSLGWEVTELPNERPDTRATRVRLRFVGEATVKLLAQSAIDVTTHVRSAVGTMEQPEITLEKR